MSNVKISGLPTAGTLTGTESVPMVQGGATKKATAQAIANLANAPTGANPTATAGPAAVNGAASTFMRSDAAPAVQLGSSSQKGIVQVDNTTINASAGVISATLALNTAKAYTDTQIAAIPDGTNLVKGKSQGDGKTVNINSGVASVKGNALCHPGFQSGRYYTYPDFSAGANTAVTANRLYALPFFVPYSLTFSEAMVSISAGVAASSGEIGIYANNNGVPDALEYDCGTISVAGTGLISITGLSLALDPGWHWLAFASNAAPSLRSTNANITTLNYFGFPPGNISAASETLYRAWTFSAGALPNPFGAVTYGGAGNQPLVFLKI